MSANRYVYTSAIVVIPPEEVWPPIQSIRQLYDEKMRRWMPHITLIYPFWPHERFPEAVSALSPALAQVEPFRLTLRRFDVFAHGRGKYTMWLDPEPAQPLEELYRLLVHTLQIPLGTGPFRLTFRPHLSVGQLREASQRDRVLRELTAGWQPLEFIVGDIALIWRNEPPDDIFRVGYRIPLGG